MHLFAFRNFAVGTAYSRTEPAQAALFGLIFLAERISLGTILAIAMSVFGVMLISVAHTTVSARTLVTSLTSRTAVIGLTSGTAFGISAVAYRAASVALGGPNFMMQAAVTLMVVTVFQTVIMLVWMSWKERSEFVRIAKAWKLSLFVGLVGGTASFGWFMAMTLQQAAVVKSLAQIEMLFTMGATVFFFKEAINRLEVAGCVLIVFGILVLLAVGVKGSIAPGLPGPILTERSTKTLGDLIGVSAVAYRAASSALGGPNFMMQAAVTLACVTIFQTVIMLVYMLARERSEFARIAAAWKLSLFVGLVGGTASFGWFMAMTLQQAAVVKSLAQIEMLFTMTATVFFFREKINRLEFAGCALIVAGILVLLLVR